MSAISANDETRIADQKLKTLAQAASINIAFELPKLLETLKGRQLIEVSKNGTVAVIGVTTTSALQHTSDMFDSLEPRPEENAAIDLAEKASLTPVKATDVSQELSDTFNLSSVQTGHLLFDAEQIGFVDVEKIGSNERLLFNGNLFRRDTAQKVMAVMTSLSSEEERKIIEVNELLRQKACLTVETVQNILGQTLFNKVSAIGLFDISVVSNSSEEVGFVTLPSAFSKFSSSMVEDAFDFTKAFVSSLTYGMTRSGYERGQIQMADALLSALIRGEPVGPVRAIGEDYKILELKGVVQVTIGSKTGWTGRTRTGPMMRLLKREVGELALEAIRSGDVSEHSLTALPSAAVTRFEAPEPNRERIRRKQVKASPGATNDMLSVLRTGGGF